MKTPVTELLILVMLNAKLTQSQDYNPSSETAVSDYIASSALDLVTVTSPTCADVYPTYADVYTTHTTSTYADVFTTSTYADVYPTYTTYTTYTTSTYADVYTTYFQLSTSEFQLVEPSASAVSTSYSTRVLVSELTSIASTAASVMPVASSFGYPAVSEIYHTSITESNSYQSVKSVNSLTGYETTSSDSRTTSSRYRTDYVYSTTKSFSPQSSPNTTSSVYASRDTYGYELHPSSTSTTSGVPSSLVIVSSGVIPIVTAASSSSSTKDTTPDVNSTIYTELIFATSVVIIVVSLITAITIVLVVYRVKPKVHFPTSRTAQSLRRTEEQVLVNSSAIDNTAYLDCSALDSSEMKMKEETTYPNDYEPVSYETETEDETITKL